MARITEERWRLGKRGLGPWHTDGQQEFLGQGKEPLLSRETRSQVALCKGRRPLGPNKTSVLRFAMGGKCGSVPWETRYHGKNREMKNKVIFREIRTFGQAVYTGDVVGDRRPKARWYWEWGSLFLKQL